uniref:(northern house mosquito) hypothetical protein n=1 Tax=Culex pipiens TaxID=7175 RepID=A0A8D8FLM3_CULPI
MITHLCRPWDGAVLKWDPCMCSAALLCVTSSRATRAGSTSWSARGTAETSSTGGTGDPTVKHLRSSPSVGSSTKKTSNPPRHTTLFFLAGVFVLLETHTFSPHTHHGVWDEGVGHSY